MSRVRVLVYDDAVEVPPDVRALIGVDRFGALLSRRRRVWEVVAEASRAAGYEHRHVLRQPVDRVALADDLGQAGSTGRYVYLTSDVACADPAHLARFLEKLSHAEVDLVARPDGAAPDGLAASLSADALRRLLSQRSAPQRRAWLSELPAQRLALEPAIVGLGAPDQLLRFLGASFQARAFNRVETADRRTVTKRSHDHEKLRREHDWWYLLPPALQRFAVQPFDPQRTAEGGSYRMERLAVPDLGLLWVHGLDAVPEEAFVAFLGAIGDWMDERPVRSDPALAAERARARYVDKVEERVARLLQTPTGQHLDRVLIAATPTGGLRALVDRYRGLLAAEWDARGGPGETVAVTHGDLCFSNVLFDKRTGLVRFIDPRGASTPDELWDDPLYDWAKLSHSVLGGYDFVNSELFDVTLDGALQLALRLDRPPPGPREEAFVALARAQGHDPVRIRLYEASLFLSMLPLHAEAPQKLVAFVLRAVDALDAVEQARRRAPSALARWLGAT